MNSRPRPMSMILALVCAVPVLRAYGYRFRDIYENTAPRSSPTVLVHDLTSKDSSKAYPLEVHTRTTIKDIISEAIPSAAEDENVLSKFSIVDADQTPVLEHHMGWLVDGQKLYIRHKETASSSSRTGVRSINVFRNGAADNGVNVKITRADTVASIVKRTRVILGVPGVLLDGQPPARLFDEGGMEVEDSDIGWLQSGANLYIVPASRYFVWPTYPAGTKFAVKFPSSPVPGKDIELEVLSSSPRLFRIRNFLGDEEISELVEKARSKLEPSVTGANADGTHRQRTSTNSWDHHSESAKALIARAFDLARVPYNINLRDAIQVLHYNKYDRYISHTDWFQHGFKNWNTLEIGSTNRYVTIFFYLNDVEEGGHTAFPDAEALPYERYTITQEQWDSMPEAAQSIRVCEPGSEGIHVAPKRGDAIMFFSQGPDGKLDYASRHAACPVLSGEKWAANVWIWSGPRPEMKPSRRGSPNAVSLTFKNTRNHAIQILYLGDEDEEFFTSLLPGEDYDLTSYKHHEWVFRHPDTQALVGSYTVTGDEADTQYNI